MADSPSDAIPRLSWLRAGALFALTALTLCWPMLGGAFLAGPHSDQYIAGYGFRLFGAEAFRDTGSIPLWNPFIFGGMPFVGGMHGDIFYPTAWLRWILPTGTAMNLGFYLHLVLAGWFAYGLLRNLGLSVGAALVGGLAFQLSGITASLVQPGHDGKLFVTALTPLLFLGLLRGIRHRRLEGFGIAALATGLSLHGHPQLSTYLLIAAGLWTLYLVFLDPDRPARSSASTAGALGLAALAVALGVGLYTIQLLPALEYLPFSPRGAGGPSAGYEYATGFSMPPEEIMSTILPQFNGVIEAYWGRNGLKLHTEYLGAIVLVLAGVGVMSSGRRSLKLALGGIAALFLLVALGGHTPFYRVWYEFVPMMKTVRAPGMAFFLVAFVVSIFAAFGAEGLLRSAVSPRRILAWGLPILAVGVLGVLGVLQPIAEGIAEPQALTRTIVNADQLRQGSLRLVVIMLAGGAVLFGLARGVLRGRAGLGLLLLAVLVDLWSVDRRFFTFQPPTSITYADDQLTATMRQAQLPYRAWDPAGAYAGAGVYHGKSWLMAYGIPTLLGYHGNELNAFDELLGGKNAWNGQVSPNIWDLYAVRFLLLAEAQEVPGYHQVAGPAQVTSGGQGVLLEADSIPPWVRVVPGAAKLPEAQIAPTILDPRFPVNRVVLYSDTTSVDPAPLGAQVPDPAPVRARLVEWRPGYMNIALDGRSENPVYLLAAENWYPDWKATADGAEVPVHRANGALLSVVLPPGTSNVTLTFTASARYRWGRTISLLSLALIGALVLVPVLRRRENRAIGSVS